MLFLETLSAAAWIGVAVLAILDASALCRLPRGGAKSGQSVTLIVPARNEERNITAWIKRARQQRVRDLRIIVADDSSEDATAARAREAIRGDHRARLLRCAPPPPGWVGKPWAAYQAALRANTQWLCFSDADMRMHAHVLGSALGVAQDLGADALSLTPKLDCRTFLERQIMPTMAMLIFSAVPVVATHNDRVPLALLAGGFMLIRTDAYWLVGGHAAVRASIAEDRDLAERLKGFGFRLRMCDGSDAVHVRMYRGLTEMWCGWRKNVYDGVRRKPWAAALSAVAAFGMLVLPMPLLLWLGLRGVTRPTTQNRRLAFACAVCTASTILVRLLRDRSIGFRTTLGTVLTTPFAGLFVGAVMLASAWGIQSGKGQPWKGRTVY